MAKKFTIILGIITQIVAVMTLSGCGKSAFNVSDLTESQQAAGALVVPPKLDLWLVEDDTGVMIELYSHIRPQVNDFLNQLDRQRWDYHFFTTPLIKNRDLTQVVGSHFDSNWGSQWTPAYPGQKADEPGMILPGVFSTPSSYTQYVDQFAQSMSQPGLMGLQKNYLSGNLKTTNAIRHDSKLVILMLAANDDTSGLNICVQNGRPLPCGQEVPAPKCTGADADLSNDKRNMGCDSRASSLDYYYSQIKTMSKDVQVYAGVANQQGSNCWGGTTNIGTRYKAMAARTGGTSYDICQMSVGDILADIGSRLSFEKISYKTRYIPISQDAEPSSIKVSRVSGGVTTLIPQAKDNDPNDPNGWSYSGVVENSYVIDYPENKNSFSGYAIRLGDNVRITGDESSKVDFLPRGAQSSVSQ